MEDIKSSTKTIPDYPKSGIQFRDITSLLINPKIYAASIELLVERYRNVGINKVVGTEAGDFYLALLLRLL